MSEEKRKNKNIKWMLLGKTTQFMGRFLRFVCRERSFHITPYEILEIMRRETLNEMRKTNKELKDMGLHCKSVEKDINTIIECNMKDLYYRIWKKREHKGYNDYQQCGYEKDTQKRSCWSCKIIAQVQTELRNEQNQED